MNKNKKRIFVYTNGQADGCYYYRVDVFLRYSKKFQVYSDVDFAKGKRRNIKYITKKIKESEIVIFLRPLDGKYLALFEVLKMAGKCIFVNNDDDFKTIDRNNPAYVLAGNKAKTNELFVEKSDGIIGSTTALTKKMGFKNPNFVCVPNFIDFQEFYFKHKVKPNNRVRVGITGSAATPENTSNFVHTLKEIQGKYKNDIELIFFSDEASLCALKKHFEKNCEFVKGVPFQKYAEKLMSLNLDIALIPRKDNEFNRYKSNCKYLELASLGVAVIAQGFPTKDGPYDKDIKNKENGIIVYNDDDWFCGIEYLLDKQNREKIVKNAYKFVKSRFDIQKNIHLWDEAIAKLTVACKKRKVKKTFSVDYYQDILEQLIFGDEHKKIKQQAQIIRQKDQEIIFMQSSKFWKLRNIYIHYKNGIIQGFKDPSLFFVFLKKRFAKLKNKVKKILSA